MLPTEHDKLVVAISAWVLNEGIGPEWNVNMSARLQLVHGYQMKVRRDTGQLPPACRCN